MTDLVTPYLVHRKGRWTYRIRVARLGWVIGYVNGPSFASELAARRRMNRVAKTLFPSL